MTREQLLRDLKDMAGDAKDMCGSLSSEECDELRERYERAEAILEKVVKKTPPPLIRDIAKRLTTLRSKK